MPGFLFVSGHAAGTIVVVCPVAAGQVRVGDSGAGVGGVDELAVSGIDAHMGNAAGICIGKEDNVTGLQLILGNGSALLILVSGGPVGGEAQLLKDIVDETGAVKACRRSAAVNVGGTQIFFCFCQNGITGYIGRNLAGRTAGSGAAVQGRGTGGDTGGFSAPEELGAVGGILIFT